MPRHQVDLSGLVAFVVGEDDPTKHMENTETNETLDQIEIGLDIHAKHKAMLEEHKERKLRARQWHRNPARKLKYCGNLY